MTVALPPFELHEMHLQQVATPPHWSHNRLLTAEYIKEEAYTQRKREKVGKRMRCENMQISLSCYKGMQQLAHLSPPIGHQVKHSAPLLKLFFHFRHEESAKRFVEPTGRGIRL